MECFTYQPANGTWVVSATLAYSHWNPGFTFHDELGLVIIGDRSGPNWAGSEALKVEHTQDGQTIQVMNY